MKKLFTASLLLLATISFAQTYTIKYTEGSVLKPDAKTYYTLTFSNNESEYRKNPVQDNNNPLPAGTEANVITQKNERFYYKDYNLKKILFETHNGKYVFQGDDAFLNWDWQLSNETKTIAGYNCQKATGTYKGITYTAWFTKDLPQNAGPEKFDGLPGTILEVSVFNRYMYTAESVTINTDKAVIHKPAFTGKTVTFEEIANGTQMKMGR